MKFASFLEHDSVASPISPLRTVSAWPRPAVTRPRPVPTLTPALAINGRFLSQSVTGVQRVARAVVCEIDRLLGEGAFKADIALIHPPTANPAALKLRNIRTEAVGRGHGAQWEQLSLPFAVGNRPLLCLGNIAPALSLLGRKPVSVMVHDFSYLDFPKAYRARYRWSHRIMLPLLLARADTLFVVSMTERERLLELNPGAASRVVVAPNGGWPRSDDDRPASPPAPPADLPSGYILYVGSLSHRKNFDRLFQTAVTLAREDGLSFVFTGSIGNILRPPQRDVPSDLTGRIHFTGQIDEPHRLAELYSGARLLVFPSLYEASPLPPFEAAHFGCPVVASNIPSIWERCDEGVTYCDPQSVPSITTAVRNALANDEERERRHDINAARAEAASWGTQASTILTALLGPAAAPAPARAA
ncbi:MAG: glycosyl transferase [Novosphingobium sp.]|nr:glycosyl transferase [Novosphingobium sp.]